MATGDSGPQQAGLPAGVTGRDHRQGPVDTRQSAVHGHGVLGGCSRDRPPQGHLGDPGASGPLPPGAVGLCAPAAGAAPCGPQGPLARICLETSQAAVLSPCPALSPTSFAPRTGIPVVGGLSGKSSVHPPPCAQTPAALRGGRPALGTWRQLGVRPQGLCWRLARTEVPGRGPCRGLQETRLSLWIPAMGLTVISVGGG